MRHLEEPHPGLVPALLDQASLATPQGVATVEDRDRIVTEHLQGPVDPGRAREVGRALARGDDDDVDVLVHAEVTDEDLHLVSAREHAVHAVPRAEPVAADQRRRAAHLETRDRQYQGGEGRQQPIRRRAPVHGLPPHHDHPPHDADLPSTKVSAPTGARSGEER
jgi:hypothetical protein